MSGVITAAVVVGTASMYSADQANSAADARASSANTANALSATRSRELAAQNAADRKEELLRRFNVKAGKIQDSTQQINLATASKLTNLDMQMKTARSATDNTLATKHVTGRLADRLKSVQDIKGSMAKGSIIQASETQTKGVSEKLETLAMDVESEQMNLGIDLSNSINAANNAEVRGYSYSSSTGTAGMVVAGISGASSGASLGMSASTFAKQQ